MQTISDTLRAEIQRSDLSIHAISIAAGVKAASLYRFVSGKRDLQLWTVDHVAQVLGLELVARRPAGKKARKGR